MATRVNNGLSEDKSLTLEIYKQVCSYPEVEHLLDQGRSKHLLGAHSMGTSLFPLSIAGEVCQ